MRTNGNESTFSRRQAVYQLIKKGNIGLEVIENILPDGVPTNSESSLWDYKSTLPILPADRKPSQQEKERYNEEMTEIVKDGVAFYNSYGGYLIIGVNNKNELIGIREAHFACDDLNKKIEGATGHNIECHFHTMEIVVGNSTFLIGLIFIPQRPDLVSPAQFRNNAPQKSNGTRAYSAGDIYLRQRDEARPAKSAEDFVFLITKGRRVVLPVGVESTSALLENNLPERDKSLIRFIGRDEYIEKLWRWLTDRYTTVKLLSGPGGVGKTTIARTFAEEIVRNAPEGAEKLIWLSAKRRRFSVVLGKEIEIERVRFSDLNSLLRALAEELGATEEEIDPNVSREELVEHVIEALGMLPSVIIVDDVDSLPSEEQHDVFRTMSKILDRVSAVTNGRSRAIFTARLTLGAAPSELQNVDGLPIDEFAEYVTITAEALQIKKFGYGPDSKIMHRFHNASRGSPLFAASILRLVSLGESIQGAIDQWRGSEGEDVRKFAFDKELDTLTDSQIRTLFAASQLAETSFVELLEVTQSPRSLLRDDIAKLREFHLVALGDIDAQLGSAPIEVPGTIRLMNDVMRTRIHDPSRIEQACLKVRSGSKDVRTEAAHYIHQTNALWRQGEAGLALETAELASQRLKDHPDIQCLLGCALVLVNPPRWADADVSFRKANKLGSERSELFPRWMEVKRNLNDWVGLKDIANIADAKVPSADNIVAMADAQNALGDEAQRNGSWSVAADHYCIGAELIFNALLEKRGKGRTHDLLDLKTALCEKYVLSQDRRALSSDQKIEVWAACRDSVRYRVASSNIVNLGARRLEEWCNSVLHRHKYEKPTHQKIEHELAGLEDVTEYVRRGNFPRAQLVDSLEATIVRIQKIAQDYGKHLGL